ncbi:MAG: hypothetical protein JXQ89_06085 [Pelagimonas sp.]
MLLMLGKDFVCPNCEHPQNNLALWWTFKGGNALVAFQSYHGCPKCGAKLRLRAQATGLKLLALQLGPVLLVMILMMSFGFAVSLAFICSLAFMGVVFKRSINTRFYRVEEVE